jgi:arabinogalactan endo-1,4-beta-galactosidase
MIRRLLPLVLVVLVVAASARADEPFILGADISWVPQDEAEGAEYFDHGRRADIFDILKRRGFNFIRLRVFVDPKSPGGYAERLPEAFCDKAHVLAMARRAKGAGMGILLDFHYSDTWADPGKQFKPHAWKDLSLDDLKKALAAHTRDVLAALNDQGTPPQMIQTGNEITNGFLWPDGHIDHFDQFAQLLKSATAAARETCPQAKIVLHHDKGRDNAVMRWWLDNLLSRGVSDFDVIGMSCYAEKTPGDWKRNIDDLAVRYPKYHLLVAEYSAQKRYVNDTIFAAPGGKGIGSFIWEPTRWREAIFDKDGHNAGERPRPTSRPTTTTTTRTTFNGGRYDTNALIELYPQMAKDYAARPAP